MNLSELKDFELAFLFYYRLGTYMPTTKELIINEIKKRHLSEQQLLLMKDAKEAITTSSNDSCCPRCKSTNFSFLEESYYNSTGKYNFTSDAQLGIYSVKNCNICGFDFRSTYQIPSKNKGFLKLIFGKFFRF